MAYYYDLETACREGVGDRKLMAMIRQRLLSMGDAIDESEQDFLTGYAYQDLRYYLMYRFGLINMDSNEASLELCKKVLSNEALVMGMVDEWFSWWIIKWRQRVRLVFNEGEQREVQNLSEMVSLDEVMKKIPKKLLDRLRREITVELIKQNEVCSLDIISDFVLKTVLNEMISEFGKDNTLRMLATDITNVKLRMLRKIMEIKNSNQPLVILKVKISPSQPYQRTM